MECTSARPANPPPSSHPRPSCSPTHPPTYLGLLAGKQVGVVARLAQAHENVVLQSYSAGVRAGREQGGQGRRFRTLLLAWDAAGKRASEEGRHI